MSDESREEETQEVAPHALATGDKAAGARHVFESKKRTGALACATACAIVIADRITKAALCRAMHEGQSIPILPKIFHLTLVFNKGIAFGLFGGKAFVFVAAGAAIIAAMAAYAARTKARDALTGISFGLIIGGALGNLVDRMRFGYVIDFLDFRVWPVFNIADSSITIGAIALAWGMIVSREG